MAEPLCEGSATSKLFHSNQSNDSKQTKESNETNETKKTIETKHTTEKRPRKIILPGEEYHDQIVELLNKGFMDDPVSKDLWPDPLTRERGHRAMFYALLANQRIQDASTNPSTGTFVNAVIDDDATDATGLRNVRAASIWTTPEGPKATMNNMYYGFKYLGFLETLNWARHFLRDFHDIVGQVFQEILQIRKHKRRENKTKQNKNHSAEVVCGDVGESTGVVAGGADGSGDTVAMTEKKKDENVVREEGEEGEEKEEEDEEDEEARLAFPDFIAADAKLRGQGYGSDVMEDALRRCKEAGKIVFIISSNEKNLSFYAKFGFVQYVEKPYGNVIIFGLAPSEI